MKKSFIFMLTLSILILASGCSDDNGDDVKAGQVQVRLLDLSSRRVTASATSVMTYAGVVVAIQRIEIKGDNGLEILHDYSASPRAIDLVTLGDAGLTLFNDDSVAVRTYKEVRLILSAPEEGQGAPTNPASYVTLPGDSVRYALFVPSGAQTGLKINLQPNLIIQPGKEFEIKLDFNSENSIHKTGGNNGRYIVQPTAIMATVEELGG